MKIEAFDLYSNNQLRDLYILLTISIGDWDKPFDSSEFPEVAEFINKENPKVGNSETRKVRVMNLLRMVILNRFIGGLIH